LDKEGKQRVHVESIEFLTDEEYFLVVKDSVDYPVVPSFRDWQFPHDTFRDHFPNFKRTGTASFDRCVITNTGYATKRVHLVPKSEYLWYNRNDLARYSGGIVIRNVNNDLNILPLKKDIHHCFDNMWFAFVPRKVQAVDRDSGTQYVSYILTNAATELWPEYHNIIVDHPSGDPSPFLFARFAYTVILGVKDWILRGKQRSVMQLTVDQDVCKYIEKRVSGDELQKEYGGGGSKGAMPMEQPSKKRKVGQANTDDDASSSPSDDELDET